MSALMTASDASGAAVAAYMLLVMIARLVGGFALFSWGLPPREGLGRRVGVIAGLIVAAILAALAITGRVTLTPLAGALVQLLFYTGVLAAGTASVMYLTEASLWTALYCVTSGYTAQNLASGTTELLTSILLGQGIDPLATAPLVANTLLPAAAVYGLTYVLLVKRLSREGLAEMQEHSMAVMFPVVSLVIIGFDLVIKLAEQGGIALGLVVALRLFHGLTCAFALWMAYELLYRKHLEQERSTAQRLLVEHDWQLRQSEQTIEAINIKCHDLRHQIRELAGGGVVDPAALESVAREVRVYDSAVKTGNTALDTILTEKSLLCESRQITLTCIADGATLDFMEPADLYALFGNALDNAIEAVSALDEPNRRTISLVVRESMGAASVHVENYFAGTRDFAGGLPVSTKGDELNHGFGTRSMRQIVERYGGTLALAAEGGTFRLDALIPRG